MEKQSVIGYNPTFDLKQHSYIVDLCIDIFGAVVGKSMEQIEALGLPQKQEDAAKNLLKKDIWRSYNGMLKEFNRHVPELANSTESSEIPQNSEYEE